MTEVGIPFEEIPFEQFQKLPPSEMKAYLQRKAMAEGTADYQLGSTTEGGFATETIADVQGDQQGGDAPALPPPENKDKIPPGGEPLSGVEDGHDLPPSMKGEVGDLESAETSAETPVEKKDAEGEAVETPVEKQPEPYLAVSDKTKYLNKEEAIKGVKEKDELIAEQKNELASWERRARRMEAELEQLRNGGQVTQPGQVSSPEQNEPTQPSQQAKPEPETPPEAPTNEEMYSLWEEDDGGPVKMVERGLEHLFLTKYRDQIALLDQLKNMNAAELLGNLQALDAPGIIGEFYKDMIFTDLDEEYPEFEGHWRDENHPMNEAYVDGWLAADRDHKAKYGFGLEQLSTSSAEGAKEAMRLSLQAMKDHGYWNGTSGEAGGEITAPETPAQPSHTEPEHTPAEVPANQTYTKEEAEALANRTAQIALASAAERDRLHGGAMTEGASAKTSTPAEKTQAEVVAEIRQDPMGWYKRNRGNPKYANMRLDALRSNT